jgi:hypothetical protein
LRELGTLELIENNIEKADVLLKRALSIYQEIKHVEIYTVLNSLADLYIKKSLMDKPNDPQKSQNFKNKAIGIKTSFRRCYNVHIPRFST